MSGPRPLQTPLISSGPNEALNVSLSDVEAAVPRVSMIARKTPLIESRTLSKRLGGRVLVKSEGFQRTNSFKVRGLYNLLAQMPTAVLAHGIVARSSGNLGKSLATAAAKLDIPCTLIMPMDAPPLKMESATRAGARIVHFNRFRENSNAVLEAVAKDLRAFIIHRGEDPEIIAGHGTVAIEMNDDCERLNVKPDIRSGAVRHW